MESNLQKYSVYMMSILIHVAMPKSSYNMGILHVICLISLMLCAKLFEICFFFLIQKFLPDLI